ncbi:hypothetical protein F4810DRAFT_685865 [Camillea tinctor]|nr:hypothetical protein F4810DRAFT_685865 [Camillea tinctor]
MGRLIKELLILLFPSDCCDCNPIDMLHTHVRILHQTALPAVQKAGHAVITDVPIAAPYKNKKKANGTAELMPKGGMQENIRLY